MRHYSKVTFGTTVAAGKPTWFGGRFCRACIQSSKLK